MQELMKEYAELADRCRTFLEKEIQHYEEGRGELAEELLDDKKTMNAQLTLLLRELKVSSRDLEETPSAVRAELNFIQQKFMQLIKLEREVEKAYLGQGKMPAYKGNTIGAKSALKAYQQGARKP